MILSRLKRLVVTSVKVLRARCVHWTKPLTSSLSLGALADLARSKPELVAENARLRVPLIVLKRQVKRPVCTKKDRILLVLLARAVRAWKQTLFIVQPETLVRGPREALRLFWRRKSRAHYQGIMQQLSEAHGRPLSPDCDGGKVISFSVLGGLHHDYRRVA